MLRSEGTMLISRQGRKTTRCSMWHLLLSPAFMTALVPLDHMYLLNHLPPTWEPLSAQSSPSLNPPPWIQYRDRICAMCRGPEGMHKVCGEHMLLALLHSSRFLSMSTLHKALHSFPPVLQPTGSCGVLISLITGRLIR